MTRVEAGPSVSVVIPAFDTAATLGRAIDSVLAQDPLPTEIIVVDDGSSDATPAVVRSYGDRVVSRRLARNGGVAHARNEGIRIASGDLIAFLDADDAWPIGSLATHVEAFRLAPGTEATLGLTQLVLDHSDGARHHGAPWLCPVFGALVCERSVMDRVGPLDETLRTAEDLDWIARARAADIRFTELAATSLLYHRRPGSLTSSGDAARSGVLSALRYAVERRRAAEQPDDAAAEARAAR